MGKTAARLCVQQRSMAANCIARMALREMSDAEELRRGSCSSSSSSSFSCLGCLDCLDGTAGASCVVRMLGAVCREAAAGPHAGI
jgi:hypothetical protein